MRQKRFILSEREIPTQWYNIQADMRDYHQWKTGVRVDGLFGPLGMIGTAIGFFTGMFYPAIYEKMGIQEDYSVLHDDVLLLCYLS